MCGVAGIYAYHYAANPVDRDELGRIRDHMATRGPDGVGEWLSGDGRLGLGHRRLAIIDLSPRAAQPMTSADGQLVISLNGEIYNYRELRAQLERDGAQFRTQSDTEVLLELYRRRGVAMFAELRGMYAFLLWDAQKNALLLARDPYGIKPLYYADDGWTLRAASQVKALLASPRVSRALEPAGAVGFYLWGSVPEPFTLYGGIRAVPAGCFVWVDELGAGAPVEHSSIARALAAADGGESVHAAGAATADIAAVVREALLESVRYHLVSDVPVGVFLSSGIDSATLVALMREVGYGEITTITLAFGEFAGTPDDEAPLAEQVAAQYGTRHHTRRVSLEEFRADLPRIFEAMDQPTIDGINTWFVAKAAREQGLRVAISGLGGDELFGGYPSFRDIPRWVRWLGVPSRIPGMGSAFRGLVRPLRGRVSPKLSGLVQYGGSYAGAYLLKRGLFLPAELRGHLPAPLQRRGLRRLAAADGVSRALRPDPMTAPARVTALESQLYMRNQLLRDTDWASMDHSVEVRVPLVDYTLLRRLAPLVRASVLGKNTLAQVARPPLPGGLPLRPKTGFSTPLDRWLSAALPGSADRAQPWARAWASRVMQQVGPAL